MTPERKGSHGVPDESCAAANLDCPRCGKPKAWHPFPSWTSCVVCSPDRPAACSSDAPFVKADKAASVAHDFIHGLNGVTKAQANAAIWTIHEVLRPLIPISMLPDHDEVMAELARLAKEGERG